MASTSGISNSFKAEAMSGIHALGVTVVRGATTVDTIKAALYLSSGTTGPTNTVYTVTGEATGTGYTAGGITVTNANAPAVSGSTGIWTPSASLVYTTVSVGPVDGVMLYNSTQANRAIEVCTFTAQTPVAATLTLTMPAGGAGTSLINIA